MPTNVWEYPLGDYRVLKKWLSHREEPSSVAPSMKTKLVIRAGCAPDCRGTPPRSSARCELLGDSPKRTWTFGAAGIDDGHAVRLATGVACRADIPNSEAAADFAPWLRIVLTSPKSLTIYSAAAPPFILPVVAGDRG